MRTACKSAYNNSAMSLQCTHVQRSMREMKSNRSTETVSRRGRTQENEA